MKRARKFGEKNRRRAEKFWNRVRPRKMMTEPITQEIKGFLLENIPNSYYLPITPKTQAKLDVLTEHLTRLNEQQLRIVWSFYRDGKTYEQIGTSEGHSRTWAHNTMQEIYLILAKK